MSTSTAALERNIQVFPVYKAATSVLPWFPIFFLYFLERVSLADAVLLGSVYYFSVFLLEVPSGVLSDRYGRRPTLLLAAILTTLAYAVFMLANSFAALFVAQVLLAAGIAFQSGSDSALLFDSLRALKKEQEYTRRETIAQKWSMYALAFSSLAGGVLAMIDLRVAYLAAFLAAVVSVAQCMKFVEPPTEGDSRAGGPFQQIRDALGYFTHPLLGWVLGFFIVGYALQHVPSEFYQPYLKLLGQTELVTWLAADSIPLVSAVVLGVSMFGGAIGATVSQRLGDRIGFRALLLIGILVQVIIIAGLSLLLHPAMLALVMFRNFSMSMTHGPMLGAIAPHVMSAKRATFLSLLSLSGRAAFALMLAVLSVTVVGNEALNWQALSSLMGVSALTGIVALLILYGWSRRMGKQWFETP